MSYTLKGNAASLEDIQRDIALLKKLEIQVLQTQKISPPQEEESLKSVSQSAVINFDQLISYPDILAFAEKTGFSRSIATRVWNHIVFCEIDPHRRGNWLFHEQVPLGKFACHSMFNLLNLMPNVSEHSSRFVAAFLKQWKINPGDAKIWMKDIKD